jgi:hypothetical protein
MERKKGTSQGKKRKYVKAENRVGSLVDGINQGFNSVKIVDLN